MVNYENAIVYMICCKDVNISDIYIGSTTNLLRRKQKHKHSCTVEDAKGYNYYVYQFIRENGHWDNWDVVQIEQIPCENKQEMLALERKHIEELHATLNANTPGRTQSQWYLDNRDSILERVNEYRINNRDVINAKKREHYYSNKDEIKIKQKEYYNKNKDKILDYHHKYHQEHKEEIAEYRKQYRHKNKEKLQAKVTCECGAIVGKYYLPQHKKTQTHLSAMDKKA